MRWVAFARMYGRVRILAIGAPGDSRELVRAHGECGAREVVSLFDAVGLPALLPDDVVIMQAQQFASRFPVIWKQYKSRLPRVSLGEVPGHA